MHTKWNHPIHLTVHSLGRKSIYSAESHGSKEDKEEKENVFCQKVLDSTVHVSVTVGWLLVNISPCVHIWYIPVGKIVPSSSKNSGSPSTMNTVTVLPPWVTNRAVTKEHLEGTSRSEAGKRVERSRLSFFLGQVNITWYSQTWGNMVY